MHHFRRVARKVVKQYYEITGKTDQIQSQPLARIIGFYVHPLSIYTGGNQEQLPDGRLFMAPNRIPGEHPSTRSGMLKKVIGPYFRSKK